MVGHPFLIFDRTEMFVESANTSLDELLKAFAAARADNLIQLSEMTITPETLARALILILNWE